MKDRFHIYPLGRLGSKMLLGFLVVVASLSLLGVLTFQRMMAARSSAEEAAARFDAVLLMQEFTGALAAQTHSRYELFYEERESEIADFQKAAGQRQENLDSLRAFAETPQEQEWLARLVADTDRLDSLFMEEMVPAWRTGNDQALAALEAEVDTLLFSVNETSGLLAADYQSRNLDSRQAADLAVREARSYLIFATLAGLSLSLIFAIITTRRLTRPIEELKEAALAMATGDFKRRAAIASADEIAELGEAFNRMADAIQHKLGQMTRLSDIALSISSELDWEQTFDVVMEKGIELTGSQAAAIALYDEERHEFDEIYTRGLSDRFIANMSFRPGGLADEVLSGEQAVFSDDVSSAHGLSRLAREEGISAFVCLPLKVRQKKLGVLYIYSKEMEAYAREELAVLSILSSQAAVAIQNASMFKQSRKEAVSDGLTGLYNQRYFYKRLKEEVERSSRTNKPVSVIFADLDRFKSFNDLNGHACGDKALREVGRIISESKRAIDIAARYGGEEFALVLPETDCRGAQIIAHRIRRRVAGFVFNTKSGSTPPLTISIGVASYPADAGSASDLVEKADWSMYYGKRQGGNRVTLFHEEADGFEHVSMEDLVREELHLAAVQTMAASVDERGSYSQRHAESVARLASGIATRMGLSEEEIHRLRVAGLLHDIGLVSVPEEIINKTGRLEPEEWNRIKEHPETGEAILRHISSFQDFLPLVRHHHEHFDGAGYPDGLAGEKIPVGARILSVADAFQAMMSDRPYRKAMTAEQALRELKLARGRQFDPAVVDAFIATYKLRPAHAP